MSKRSERVVFFSDPAHRAPLSGRRALMGIERGRGETSFDRAPLRKGAGNSVVVEWREGKKGLLISCVLCDADTR